MSLLRKLEKDGLQRECQREVQELHNLFVAWFQGTKPQQQLRQEFAMRLQPGFSHVAPNGQFLHGRHVLLGHLEDKYGCYKDRVFHIDIYNVQLLWNESNTRCLCTYEEWQSWQQDSEDEEEAENDPSSGHGDDDDEDNSGGKGGGGGGLLQFGRLSTCLLERRGDASANTNGANNDDDDDDHNPSPAPWTWVHVHETWLEADRPPETSGKPSYPPVAAGDEDTVLTGPIEAHKSRLASSTPLTTTSKSRSGGGGGVTTATTLPGSERSEPRLIVLMSGSSLSQQQKQQQETALNVLATSGVPHDTVDGTSFAQRNLREELFDISGVRAKYPQFFIAVREEATYWGDYDRLASAHNNGTLLEDLGLNLPHATPPASPNNNNNNVDDDTGAAGLMAFMAARGGRGSSNPPPPSSPPKSMPAEEQHPANWSEATAPTSSESMNAAPEWALASAVSERSMPTPFDEKSAASSPSHPSVDPILGASMASSKIPQDESMHTGDSREEDEEDDDSSTSSGSSSSTSTNSTNSSNNSNDDEGSMEGDASTPQGAEPDEQSDMTSIDAPEVMAKALKPPEDEAEQAFLNASRGILVWEDDEEEDDLLATEKEPQDESSSGGDELILDGISPIPHDVSSKRHVSPKLTKYAKPLVWENALVGLHISGFDVGSSQGPMGDEAWYDATGSALEDLAQSPTASRPRRKLCLPEQVFPTAHIALEGHGYWISWDAMDALEEWAKAHQEIAIHSTETHQGVSVLKSKDASLWESRRKHGSTTDGDPNVSSVFHYDWTYSTPFCGKAEGGDWQELDGSGMRMSLLTDQSVPILFFDEVVLYEDDLHDNGQVSLVAKIRVMPSCAYVLCRLYCRVDEVVVRCRETRVLVDFFGIKPQVYRDVTWRECYWPQLAGLGLPTDVRSWRFEAETPAFNDLLKRLPEVSPPATIPKHALLVPSSERELEGGTEDDDDEK